MTLKLSLNPPAAAPAQAASRRAALGRAAPGRSAARLATALSLGGLLLAGCINDPVPAPNTLAADTTPQGMTAYPASTVGAGNTAATQDLLTAGLGRTGLGLATAPA